MVVDATGDDAFALAERTGDAELGGDLSLVAEFPDSGPVILSGIAKDEPAPRPKSHGRRRV